jgi:hypothetical protein
MDAKKREGKEKERKGKAKEDATYTKIFKTMPKFYMGS